MLVEEDSEVSRLKKSVEAWKNAWFQLRELIGRVTWEHHNCPHERLSEDSVPNPWLHPDEPYVQVGKLVYAKEREGYRLIGASTSEDGAQAILRLMSMQP